MPPDQTSLPQPELFNFFETSAKKNFAPWFLKFCLALIIIGLVIAGYFKYQAYQNYKYGLSTVEQSQEQATPTLSEIEGWKTYRNEEYGFEIKYPGNLELWGSVSNKSLDYKPRYPAGVTDSIVFTKDGSLRIEAYTGQFKWYEESEESSSFIATTTFNGYPASKGNHCELGGCIEQIILEKNSASYELNLDKSSLNNQILSTFKFIE